MTKSRKIILLLILISILAVINGCILFNLHREGAEREEAYAIGEIQSNLSTLQTQAEIYYGGDGRNSYGATATDCVSGMFAADPRIAGVINEIKKRGASVTCNSIAGSNPAYAVQAVLPNIERRACADSMGHSLYGLKSTIPLGTNTVCPGAY